MKTMDASVSKIIQIVVAIIVIGGVVIYAINRFVDSSDKVVDKSFDRVDRVTSRIANFFGGERIQTRNETVYGVTVGKTELVLLENEVFQELKDQQDWGLSTKKINVRMKAKVKYGYNFKGLGEMARIFIDSKTGNLSIRFPEPCVIAIDIDPDSIEIEKENGWWNKVQPEESVEMVASCKRALKTKVEKSDYKSWVKDEMKKQIYELYREEGLSEIRAKELE